MGTRKLSKAAEVARRVLAAWAWLSGLSVLLFFVLLFRTQAGGEAERGLPPAAFWPFFFFPVTYFVVRWAVRPYTDPAAAPSGPPADAAAPRAADDRITAG